MFTRLPKGLVLKSKTYEDGGTFYTIILKNRFFFLELYKTAVLSKNWKNGSSPLEVKIRKYDFTNYIKKIIDGDLNFPEEKEITRLSESIKGLPDKTREKIYRKGKIRRFHNDPNNFLYGAEVQKISNINSGLECLSKKLSDNIKYKRKLSIN